LFSKSEQQSAENKEKSRKLVSAETGVVRGNDLPGGDGSCNQKLHKCLLVLLDKCRPCTHRLHKRIPMLNELKNMKSLQNRTCLSQRILESHQQKEATEEVETVEYQAAKQNILIRR
jgi:hypothetical protein